MNIKMFVLALLSVMVFSPAVYTQTNHEILLKVDSLMNIYDSCLQFNKDDKANEILDEALKVNPVDPIVIQIKGIPLLDLESCEKAIEFFDKLIDEDKDYWRNWYYKGKSLVHCWKFEDAVKCFDKAVDLKPENYKYLFYMGLILSKFYKHKEALTYFNKAIEMNPNDPEIWYFKAAAHGMSHEYKKSIKCCKKAIELKPDYYEVWYNMGISIGSNGGDLINGIKCMDKAIEIKPDYYEAWYMKAEILSALKNKVEAQRCFDIADSLENKQKSNDK